MSWFGNKEEQQVTTGENIQENTQENTQVVVGGKRNRKMKKTKKAKKSRKA